MASWLIAKGKYHFTTNPKTTVSITFFDSRIQNKERENLPDTNLELIF